MVFIGLVDREVPADDDTDETADVVGEGGDGVLEGGVIGRESALAGLDIKRVVGIVSGGVVLVVVLVVAFENVEFEFGLVLERAFVVVVAVSTTGEGEAEVGNGGGADALEGAGAGIFAGGEGVRRCTCICTVAGLAGGGREFGRRNVCLDMIILAIDTGISL